MRKLAGTLGVVLMVAAAVAQPAEQPKQPTTPPPAPAPAPATAPAQPGNTAAPTAAQPTAPAAPAKKWLIAADAKPVARQELEGGLIVEDFVVGTGAEVKPGSAVMAFYHGTVKTTGAEFDSAFERGQPIPFSLNGVIAGWTKGVPGMKVGGLRRLTIPAAMAYGTEEKRDQMGKVIIPANADLVFVIEVTDVIQYEDVKAGTGEEVGNRAVCTTAYVMKDASGKEVDKTTADSPYLWLPNENVFNLGLVGMKVGGKRVLTVPATMNMPGAQYPPAANHPPLGVPVTVEVELIAVRNLLPVAKPAK